MPTSPEAGRIVIAGASTLRGRDLKEWLEKAHFPAVELRLLDEEVAAGILTEAGGEPAVVGTVEEDSFEGVRFVFFTGSAGFAARYGAAARRAGSTVIDLSGGLVAEPGARPWIPVLDSILPGPAGKVAPNESQSLFLAPTAPADVAISLSAAFAPLGLDRIVLPFGEPVSERGREGVKLR